MKKIIAIFIFFFAIFPPAAICFSSETSGEGKDLITNVQNFKAVPGDSHATLSWINPENGDFSYVVIQGSIETYPVNPKEGDKIYQGKENYLVDLNLTNNTVYYYTIFVFDNSGMYSSGSIAQARPAPPSLIDPYRETSPLSAWIISTESAAKSLTKKEKIELSDFSYYFLFDKHPVKIGLNELKELRVVKNSLILFEISADIFTKPVNVITVSTSESSYLMKQLNDKNKYQVVISAPQNKGDFELRLIIIYEDKKISDLKTKLLVDPHGYIYERGMAFRGLGRGGEIRVEGAEITLWEKKSNEWQKWDAGKYYQKNPTLTEKSGEYSFFVPEGEYFLEVKKQGYFNKKSEPFKVENELINRNIELKPIFKVWYLIVFGMIIAAGVIIFFINKVRINNKQSPSKTTKMRI